MGPYGFRICLNDFHFFSAIWTIFLDLEDFDDAGDLWQISLMQLQIHLKVEDEVGNGDYQMIQHCQDGIDGTFCTDGRYS